MKSTTVFAFFLLAIVSTQVDANTSTGNRKHEHRIIGGDKAAKGQFKYTVAIQKRLVFLYHENCGATYLNENYVLTAAQCVDDNGDYRVFAGEVNLLSLNAQYSYIDQIILHPNYTTGINYPSNNIAVLKLKTPLKANDTIQPIALSQASSVTGSAVLSGWGATNSLITSKSWDLRFANMTIISLDECKNALKNVGVTGNVVDDTNICTLSKKFACKYDEGSPLAQSDTLIGVVSWILNPCDKEGAPSVYTNVAKYTTWIKEQIAG